MNKKISSFILILTFFVGNIFNLSYAFASLHGHAEKIDSANEQNELFTGSLDKLNKNTVILMNVSQVIDSTSSKEGDEFFAEVTNDVEGKDGIIIPSETIVHGRIKQVSRSKKLGRDGALDLEFDYLITPDGKQTPIIGKMSTRLHPVVSTSKVIATDIGYTAIGGAAGGLLALNFLGLSGAIASQGSTIAGGAAIGGAVGLGIALCRKGKDVLISPGDEISVKIESSNPFQVYKKSAFVQPNLKQEGLDVKIQDITYEKDPFDELNIIKLSLTVSNKTKMFFSTCDLALVDKYNNVYYPTTFGENKIKFVEIAPNNEVSGELSFSVENVKNKFCLVFYDKKNKEIITKISLDSADSKISNKSKKHNDKILLKRNNFYKENNPFDTE